MDNLQFIIPGKPEYIKMVRLAVSALAATAGFNVEQIDDLKTAVDEACRHISCHGFQKYSDKYEIDCKVDAGYLEISVKDMCGEHTLEKMNTQCRHCPQEGDLGVYVIKSLMNEVRVMNDAENGMKGITMIKRA
ncbi:MAG: ATP-binding protein [Eubacteriales bacterium]|nr:ATP-binding protein [Eubacteriales bacterium]